MGWSMVDIAEVEEVGGPFGGGFGLRLRQSHFGEEPGESFRWLGQLVHNLTPVNNSQS